MQYFGLIFDFNGVLWWDNALQESSWRDWSSAVRGYPFSDTEMAEHVHGRNNRYTQQYLSKTPLTTEQAEQLSEQKEVIYRRLCLDQGEQFRLSPGAESLLNFLVNGNIPHTIATASCKGNVDFFIEHLQLERWFDLEKIVYDDGTLAGKPAPDFYLAAAERLSLPPGRCIVVEDSLSGIHAAHATGIGYIIALVGDNSNALQETLPGVALTIHDLSEFDRSLLRNPLAETRRSS